MLEELKERVWQANLDLVKHGLVVLTFGNVSGFDRGAGLMAIKPSGLSYESLRSDDIVLVGLDGTVAEGRLKPSSDTPTHLALYRAFPQIGGISHAHSEVATAFAQAAAPIPCLGTTHADHFDGPVPVTRGLTRKEVEGDYEGNTGKVIVGRLAGRDPLAMPAVLVAGHGPFTWGRNPNEAVENAVALEAVARMALATRQIDPKSGLLPAHLLRKHFERKHGPRAYYGQSPKKEKS